MANLGDISKINLPNGNVVNIKDATARSNVVQLETMNGAKNLAPYNSGEHVGNASYWFLHTNCTDIAAGTSVYLVFDYTQTAGQYSLQLTDENGQIISGTAAYTTNGTTSGHKATKITIPTGKTAKGYNAYHNTNATVTISNFMIIPAEIYDAGFTSYQPYALPNTKITPELIELVDSGAKNELNVTAISSGNFTVNSDKSITVNGSFSQATEYTLASLTGTVKGVLSGCTNGSNTTYRMWIQYKINNGSVQRIDLLDGSVELDLSNVTWSAVQIRVESGQTLNNVKFYPMLCSKAAWDVSQKFVPYRPTYEETVEQVAENKNNILSSYDTTAFACSAANTYEYTGISITCPANKLIEIWVVDEKGSAMPSGILICDSNSDITTTGSVIAENSEQFTVSDNAVWARELHCIPPRIRNTDKTFYVWVKRTSTASNNIHVITRAIVTT